MIKKSRNEISKLLEGCELIEMIKKEGSCSLKFEDWHTNTKYKLSFDGYIFDLRGCVMGGTVKIAVFRYMDGKLDEYLKLNKVDPSVYNQFYLQISTPINGIKYDVFAAVKNHKFKEL
jgi:hypothetical protein